MGHYPDDVRPSDAAAPWNQEWVEECKDCGCELVYGRDSMWTDGTAWYCEECVNDD